MAAASAQKHRKPAGTQKKSAVRNRPARWITAARIRRFFAVCTLLFLLLLGGKVAWDLWLRLYYEIRGPYTWDSPVYWAIGRGILNGLMPYTDLFDIKPPGIFIISAASFYFTDSTILCSIFQTIAIAGFPAVFVLYALLGIRHKNRMHLAAAIIFSFILGTVFGLFVAVRSGAFQVESFGAFFAAIYILIIALKGRNMTLPWMSAAGLFLMLSIGTKEPFFLTTLAASFILCRTFRIWKESFLFPLGIAVAVGGVILLVTGYAEPYFTLYLSYIFGNHIGPAGSALERGLAFSKIYNDLQEYVVTFGAFILFLFAHFLWYRLRDSAGVLKKISVLLLTALLTYGVSLSVGIGGEYFNHHFVFAVPAYTALGIVFLRDASAGKRGLIGSVLFAGMSVSMFLSALWQPTYDYDFHINNFKAISLEPKKVASQIDDILDQCSLSRYLFLGLNGDHPFGFTTHSPLGPLFTQFPQFLEPGQLFFQYAHIRALRRANLIVFDSTEGHMAEFTNNYIHTYFTKTPWPCAGNDIYTGHYTFYYRTGMLAPE